MSHHLAVRDGIFSSLGQSELEKPWVTAVESGRMRRIKLTPALFKPYQQLRAFDLVDSVTLRAVATVGVLAGVGGLAVGMLIGMRRKR